MRRTKRLGALLIALVMIFTMLPITTAGAAATSGNIVLTMNSTTFTVNGTSTKIDAEGSKPVQSKGYTMLPLRAIVEATSGSLSYNASTKQITVVRGGDTVVLTLGSKTAKVNGANRTLGAAPYASNNRTYVHIRTLELLGMKVDWNATNKTVTVNFAAPSQIYNLTLQNGMGTAYTSVEIAPAGTTNWSGNLLGADTLAINGNIIVQAPLTGTGYYQLRCGYVSSGKTLYHTISNINLTGIVDRATILMNSATAPTVTVDGAAAGSKAITLYFVNNTGKVITGLYAKQSSASYYDSANLLNNQMLAIGGQASTSFSYNTTAPYYDFCATYNNNGITGYEYYYRVTLGTIGAQTFQTLKLGPNGSINSNGTSSSGDTEVTFKNNSGSKIYEIRVATSSKNIKSGTTVWSDSDGLKNGKSVTFDMDLGSSTKWYFGIYTSKNPSSTKSPSEYGQVNFKKTSATSATVTVNEDEYELQDWKDCDECGTDDYDYDTDYDKHKTLFDDAKDTHSKLDSSVDEDEYDKLDSDEQDHYTSGGVSFSISKIKYDGSSSSSKNDGDVDLYFLNTSGDDIEAVYVVPEDDYSSKDDYEDYQDNYDSAVEADDDEYDSASGVMEAGEEYYLVFFKHNAKDSASPYAVSKKIKVDKNADFVVYHLSDDTTSSKDFFDSEDEDTRLLWVINDSGELVSNVKLEASKKDDITIASSIKDDDCVAVLIDLDNEDEWEFNWKYDGKSYDEDIDFDDYEGIVVIEIDGDDIDVDVVD